MKQQGKVTHYIDAFKRCCSKIPSITDEEMLDRFIRGLSTNIQRELLKQDPPSFASACQMAERLARLDAVIESRFANTNKNKHTSNANNNPYHAGGFLPTDVQMSLLDYLNGGNRNNRSRQPQYDRNGKGRYDRNQQRKNNPHQGLICDICGKPNHIARNCWHNPANKRGGGNSRGGRRSNFCTQQAARGRLNVATEVADESDATAPCNPVWQTSQPKN